MAWSCVKHLAGGSSGDECPMCRDERHEFTVNTKEEGLLPAKKLAYYHNSEPIFYFDKDGNFVIPAAQVNKIFRIASAIAGYAKQTTTGEPNAKDT